MNVICVVIRQVILINNFSFIIYPSYKFYLFLSSCCVKANKVNFTFFKAQIQNKLQFISVGGTDIYSLQNQNEVCGNTNMWKMKLRFTNGYVTVWIEFCNIVTSTTIGVILSIGQLRAYKRHGENAYEK